MSCLTETAFGCILEADVGTSDPARRYGARPRTFAGGSGRTGKVLERTAAQRSGIIDGMDAAADPRGSDSMPLHIRVGVFMALLAILLCGCGWTEPEPSQRILGRWEVVQMKGMNVPSSFFWLTMDTIEFRADGEVWALILAPDDAESGMKLNSTGAYALVGEDQIEFVGACRHQDPCTGVYSLSFSKDGAQIFDADGRLELLRAGPPSAERPPRIVGPSASATPALP